MSIKSYYLSPEGELKHELSEEDIKNAFESGTGLLWVDIEGDAEEEVRLMNEPFKFHHLVISDCLSTLTHPPKVDSFDNYIFLIVHGINYSSDSDIVETAQIEMFIGKHYVFSHHTLPVFSTNAVQHMIEADGRPMKRGSDFFAHYIIDALIDNVMPTIDSMSDVTDDIEEEAIHNPRKETLQAILRLKRSTMRLHRVMAPQREILNRLSRREFSIISEEAQIFYRDIYDHLVRIEDLNLNIRDRADNALSTYLSSIANRQNETMRILSIVAAIFMPLTLLAGIYGMNFEYMPELTWRWGYFAVLGLMAIAIIGVSWWLWLSNIISMGKKRVKVIRPIKADPRKLLGYAGRITRITRDLLE
ncbi:magnesium/cobalt transporter CorA [Chloroflexota bacterium]